jgi:RhtB (resistance to homoserine/threonine) family protein
VLSEFLLLATAHIFAVASPGADFAVVLKNTLNAGKSTGLYTALGIGLGILVHVAYTLLGVAFLLAGSELLFTLIKWLGAGYLLWLAYGCSQSRPSSPEATAESAVTQIVISPFQAVKQGFFVNVLNPKVTLFFVALFTNIVSIDTPLLIQFGYGAWLSVYTFIWFAIVAWGFSRPLVLNWYQQHGHFIDWGMGVMLVVIAIRLLF